MKTKLKKTVERIRTTLGSSPIELLLAFVFCVLSIGYTRDRTLPVEGMLAYFPVFFLIANRLNQLTATTNKRVFYFCSPLLCLPFIGCHDLFSSPAYPVSLVVAQLAYFIHWKQADNHVFMGNVLRYLLALGSALLLTVVAWVLAVSIFFSIQSIFETKHAYEHDALAHLASGAFLFLLPVLFLVLHNKKTTTIQADKLFDLLFHSVLTPALLVYAAILYGYFAKIVITWSLPKGKVSVIVIAFAVALFVLKGFQPFLARKSCHWIYRYASIVVLPTLLIYWIGTCYRINQYGFTELRVYLVVIGLILTLTALLFLSERYGRYLYLASATAFLLSVVTYIPGINAKQIEACSQQKRAASGEVADDPETDPSSHISIEAKQAIGIEGYKEMARLHGVKEAGGVWFDCPREGEHSDTFYVYNADDRLLYKGSAQAFVDKQLNKHHIALGDTIPTAIYTELVRFETDSMLLLFNHISLSRESKEKPYKVIYLDPAYYLSK